MRDDCGSFKNKIKVCSFTLSAFFFFDKSICWTVNSQKQVDKILTLTEIIEWISSKHERNVCFSVVNSGLVM